MPRQFIFGPPYTHYSLANTLSAGNRSTRKRDLARDKSALSSDTQ